MISVLQSRADRIMTLENKVEVLEDLIDKTRTHRRASAISYRNVRTKHR
mgnify:CR=1 FL=1